MVLLVFLHFFFFITTNVGHTQATQPCLSPGPDAFGYKCISVLYNWDITTANATWYNGSAIMADEKSVDVSLPFNFPFYGANYSTLKFYTNAQIAFSPLVWTSLGWGFPLPTLAPNGTSKTSVHLNYIAVCTVDLIANSSTVTRSVVVGAAPNRYFVVSWENFRYFQNQSKSASCQAKLYENGDIIVNVASLVVGDWALTGIENKNGTMGLTALAGNSAVSNQAYKFIHPTNTRTNTPTQTATTTSTRSPTLTPTLSPTLTPTLSPSETKTETQSPTLTPACVCPQGWDQ